MIIREATLEDFRAFYDRMPPKTIKALCAETSTGIKGFGGFYFNNGHAVLFTDQKGDFTKREVIQCGRAMMEFAKTLTVPLAAFEGEEFGSVVMKHFGFQEKNDFWERKK